MSILSKPKHDTPTKASFYVPKHAARCWFFTHRWQWRAASDTEQYADCTKCGLTKRRIIW